MSLETDDKAELGVHLSFSRKALDHLEALIREIPLSTLLCKACCNTENTTIEK